MEHEDTTINKVHQAHKDKNPMTARSIYTLPLRGERQLSELKRWREVGMVKGGSVGPEQSQ